MCGKVETSEMRRSVAASEGLAQVAPESTCAMGFILHLSVVREKTRVLTPDQG